MRTLPVQSYIYNNRVVYKSTSELVSFPDPTTQDTYGQLACQAQAILQYAHNCNSIVSQHLVQSHQSLSLRFLRKGLRTILPLN